MQQIDMNAAVLAAVLVIGLLIAWWLIGRGRKSGQRSYQPDVLDEGVGPAERNQALIDAPSSTVAALAASGPDILGGIGEVAAAGALDEIVQAHAQESADLLDDGRLGDDLTRIKGLGPKLHAILGGLGITSFAQIAGWDEAEMARIDAQLGSFAGRPARDNWIEQARLLCDGDMAAYEEKFGKL